jgi:hypothetical protein
MDLSWLPTFSALSTPIIVAIAWWVRRRDSAVARGWRSNAALVGLIASSLNAVVFYAWVISEYARVDDGIGRNMLGNNIALPLVCIALLGAIVGEGRTRAVVAASALTGLFMWIPVAFL